jgi:hypothetical protein
VSVILYTDATFLIINSRTAQPFDSHVAALLSLLQVADQTQGDKLGIFSYVAAQCYPRMLQKFQHGSDSKLFIKCLLESDPSRAHSAERPFPNLQPIHTPLAQRDIAFISFLAKPLTEHFLHLSRIPIPKLIELAKHYHETPGAEFPHLYTRETCEEFHRLLCHLLTCYEAALSALHDLEDLSHAERQTELFDNAVYCVATCGLTLRSLVHSSFLEEHLCRILAPNPHITKLDDTSHADATSDDGELSGSGTIIWQPWQVFGRDSGSSSVRRAYVNHLRSLVAPLEAANDLVAIASRFRDSRCTINVAVVPDCGPAMLPWRTLIKEIIPSARTSNFRSFTADEAITAIECALSSNVDFAARLTDDGMGGWNFRGSFHCTACLASVVHRPELLETDSADGYEVRASAF